MSKTIYVTIPDEKLQELIDKYRQASPIDDEDDFSVYLLLEELKRFRTEPELRALTLKELQKIETGTVIDIKYPQTVFRGDSGFSSSRYIFSFRDYGKTWFAYDR